MACDGVPSGTDVACILGMLTGPEMRGLLALPMEGAWCDSVSPDARLILDRLASLVVMDPSGLVSFRLQLVEIGDAGMRLTRLERRMAALAAETGGQ